ncbi:MAG: hypothetical protein AAF687_03075 [Pseudomonadota bacterium]
MDFEAILALSVALLLAAGIGHLLSRYVSSPKRRWLLALAGVGPVLLYILTTVFFIATSNEDDAGFIAMLSAMGVVFLLAFMVPWIIGLLIGYFSPLARNHRPE